jgi:hypothetical protein
MTGYETVMAAILGRLKAAPANWGLGVVDVRRAHLTAVPKAGAPAVHLIDGADAPKSKQTSRCLQRDMDFTVALFVRSDAGPGAADGLRTEAYRRLSPDTASYAEGTTVTPGRITVAPDIADGDAIRVDLDFTACYAAGDWTL